MGGREEGGRGRREGGKEGESEEGTGREEGEGDRDGGRVTHSAREEIMQRVVRHAVQKYIIPL